jgi:serine/threonine-protein kinase
MSIIGSFVAGRYHVLQHVGRGGMQEVYRAHDSLLEMDVALKTPQAGQAVKRFRSSARLAAMVNHHNVAKTLDCFQENGVEYLIEEFVLGETLEQNASRFAYIDPHFGSQIFHYLVKGIAASHRAGVIHRDLKPSNVMVTAGVNLQELKITDFGIATLAEEVFDEAAKAGDITRSNSGTIKGALPFMAPEMMFRKQGENPGETVDIWSLGAMMFKLMTGDYPFGIYLDAAVNVKTRNRKPWPAFMSANPQFAPFVTELQAIIDSCLEYDPIARPTAAQLATRFEDVCYMSAGRSQGSINNLIQNGFSGFITGENSKAFFSKESLYGPQELATGVRVCFSSFSGNPHPRAHPVVILK